MNSLPPNTEHVWRELHQDLLAFIRSRVGDAACADDILQEVFLRIHDRIDSLADADRLRAWVFQITRNAINDHYRSEKRGEPVFSSTQSAETTAAPPSTEELVPDNLNQRVAHWLKTMVDELPPSYREAVRMAEFDKAPQQAVADRLGLSLSGAKSRIQRGRQMLKDALLRCCHFELDQRGNVLDFTRRTTCACSADGNSKCE